MLQDRDHGFDKVTRIHLHCNLDYSIYSYTCYNRQQTIRPVWGLNSRPLDYKTDTLPTVLRTLIGEISTDFFNLYNFGKWVFVLLGNDAGQ